MDEFTKETPIVVKMADTSRPKKNRPKGLRSPWEYVASIPNIAAMLEELRAVAKAQPTLSGRSGAHCFKKVTGVEIYVNYRVPHRDPAAIAKAASDTNAVLHKYLGEDANVMVREVNWIWFTTNIYFEEYVPIRDAAKKLTLR